MRIAIAYCQDRVSPVFDFSKDICLIDIEDGLEVRRELRGMASRDPFHRAREVMSFGVDVLICGALSRQMEMALSGAGIQTAGFICGGMDDVVSAFIQGNLQDGRLLMPGCAARISRRRCRNRWGKG
jgi:predicted Fe-Mo cluster-binding NifX family protein